MIEFVRITKGLYGEFHWFVNMLLGLFIIWIAKKTLFSSFKHVFDLIKTEFHDLYVNKRSVGAYNAAGSIFAVIFGAVLIVFNEAGILLKKAAILIGVSKAGELSDGISSAALFGFILIFLMLSIVAFAWDKRR